MAEIVAMPKLGFDMREGTLVRWVKKEGDTIAKGDVIAEIETDKATVEVEAFSSGVLRKTLVTEGAVVPIGDPIGILGAADEAIDLDALGVGKKPEKKSKTKEKEAKGSERDTRRDGAQQAAAATPPAAQPAQAAPAQAAPAEAAPAEAAPAQAAPSQPAQAQPSPAAPSGNGRTVASPIARRIADERGIDIRQVSGSGPGGRITRKDVENFVPPAPVAQPVAAAEPSGTAAGQPAGPQYGEKPLTRIRQTIGRRMVESKQQVPHFYVTAEIDMAAAMAMRKQANEWLDDAHKLSVNDLVIKAAATALRQFPGLNSAFGGDKIVVHEQINIGNAVALDQGLITVVVRDADRKSLSQIAGEMKTMVERARGGKMRPDDMEGSTFTLSNLGMYGIENFIAIVNPPEAGILALGAVLDVPVVKNGQVVPGQRMKATLSADHRVTDGAEVARFLQAFTRVLETPLRMLV